jgi:hypothetical protein
LDDLPAEALVLGAGRGGQRPGEGVRTGQLGQLGRAVQFAEQGRRFDERPAAGGDVAGDELLGEAAQDERFGERRGRRLIGGGGERLGRFGCPRAIHDHQRPGQGQP